MMTPPSPAPRRRSALRRIGGVVIALAAFAAGSQQQAEAATEYEIKALFLLSLAKSLSWPSNSFPNSGSPVVIGILGSDPFGSTLARVLSGETAGGRPIAISRSSNPAALSHCHIVFVSSSEASRSSAIVSALSGRSILLIGDFSPFAAKGGHLNFIMKSGSVGCEYNAPSAKRSGLRIPSKIQRSGTSVSD